MPYKHIAMQLQKTELACRLHYHQMSYGSNRRKRGASVASLASTASYTPNSSGQDHSPGRTPYEMTPMTSPAESPRSMPNRASDYLSSPPLYQGPQLPLLPKPTSNEASPRLPRPLERPSEITRSTELKLPSATEILRSPPIDPGRLRDLYQAHRQNFWSQIAHQYSPNSQISASELESAFFTGQGTTESQKPLPTPELSPSMKGDSSCYGVPQKESSYGMPSNFNGQAGLPSPRGMLSPPASASKCAVNSLLNGPSLSVQSP